MILLCHRFIVQSTGNIWIRYSRTPRLYRQILNVRRQIQRKREVVIMKCPKCGSNLKKSIKSPDYVLCENCKTSFLLKTNDCQVDGETKHKLSKCLLIAFILGGFYLIYCAFYWSGVVGPKPNTAEQIGSGIATLLVAPHILFTALAVIFNGLGLFMKKRGFALTGAILYAVSILFMPIYFMFVIVEMILSFIGFAKMKK